MEDGLRVHYPVETPSFWTMATLVHVHLPVSGLARSRSFYTETMGFVVGNEDEAMVEFPEVGLMIEQTDTICAHAGRTTADGSNRLQRSPIRGRLQTAALGAILLSGSRPAFCDEPPEVRFQLIELSVLRPEIDVP